MKQLRCEVSHTNIILPLQVGLFRRCLHRRELEDARQQLYANIWAAAQPLSKVAIKTQIGQVRLHLLRCGELSGRAASGGLHICSIYALAR